MRFDCTGGTPNQCLIIWEHPAPGAQFFTFRIFLFADLEQDPADTANTCTARNVVVRKFSGQSNSTTQVPVSIDTPGNLPSGCRVEQWVASLVAETTAGGIVGIKVSRAGVAFRYP